VVIGVLPSVGAGVAAARIAQRCGVPLILVVQDLAASPTREAGLVGAAFARGQAEVLREATRVVLIGAGLRTTVLALGVDRARIDVLADGSPTLPERPEPAPARARIGVAADDFVVLHIGNIGFGQDVPMLVRAARRVAGRTSGRLGRDLRLVLVGEGSQRESLVAAAADLPDVRFLDPVGAGDYPGLVAAADVLVVTELPGCPDRTLPGRLESYLRAGRPVLAAINPDGDADRLLRSVPAAAVIVPPGDSAALALALIRLRDDEHELAGLRAAARDYADAAIRGASASAGAGAERGLRDVVRTVLTNPR
jgi:glycosyltransferase involved in cell wall biosynthesis